MDTEADFDKDDFELCLTEYESDCSNIYNNNDIVQDIPLNPKKHISWNLLKKFDTIDEAKLHLKALKEWVYKTKNPLSSGYSVYYICKLANYRNSNKQDCRSACKIILNNDDTDVCLYISNIQHSCTNTYYVTNGHKDIVFYRIFG